MQASDDLIQEIRSFNRFYTDMLGLLNQHILDSPYSLTEVRVLYEMSKLKNCTANILMNNLNVDRGYLSRILKRFETGGLISKKNDSTDGRKVFLNLTRQGRTTLSGLEEKAGKQIENLIAPLTEKEQGNLVDSFKFIRSTLINGFSPIKVRPYTPADIDYIIKRHRDLYKKEYGFGPVFGDYVEKYVLEFHECHDEKKENIWIAEVNGAAAGAIALVKTDDSTAQLRWFLIEPPMRGRGLGHKLIRTVIDFCKEQQYKHVFLWTVNILEAARHLYKEYGFTLTETKENDSWGDSLTEERWDLQIT